TARRAESSASIRRGSPAPDAETPSPACGGGLGSWPWESRLDRGSVLLTLITHQHLITKLAPDRLVDLRKTRLEPNLSDVPRPRQVDGEGAFDGSRAGRQNDDAIGQRDRLFQVMGHKNHGRRGRRPQRKQLVLHQRPRLDVER